MQSISVEAWTDDSDMNTNDDWQTFSDSYPIAATWLQDCEASRNGEQRVVTRTISPDCWFNFAILLGVHY